MTEAIPTEGGEVKPTLPLYFGCVRADWALCFLLAVLGFVVR
ncbi:MAG: hypothetical protein JWO45_1068, partial [Spartobacteria bacterium]|nr:hypothetical protein [Spartobacteria bacterium]